MSPAPKNNPVQPQAKSLRWSVRARASVGMICNVPNSNPPMSAPERAGKPKRLQKRVSVNPVAIIKPINVSMFGGLFKDVCQSKMPNEIQMTSRRIG